MTDEPATPGRISDSLGIPSTTWVRPEDIPSYTLDQIRTDLRAALAARGDGLAIHELRRSCEARLPWHKSHPSAWHDGSFPGLYTFIRRRLLGADLAYVEVPLSAAIANLTTLIEEVMRHEDRT